MNTIKSGKTEWEETFAVCMKNNGFKGSSKTRKVPNMYDI